MSNSTLPRMLNEKGLKIAEALEAIAADLGGEGWVSGSKENERNPIKVALKDETGLRIAAALDAIGASLSGNDRRVTSLDNTDLAVRNLDYRVTFYSGISFCNGEPEWLPEYAPEEPKTTKKSTKK